MNVPGEMRFNKVKLFVGPVGAAPEELTEVGECDALDIAPNVTGGSITLHGVRPGDLLMDDRGLPVGVVGDEQNMVRQGVLTPEGHIEPALAAAISGSMAGVLTSFAQWSDAIQGAALETMRELKKAMEGVGWPMTYATTTSDILLRLTQPQVKRGSQARAWLNTLSAKQRSGKLRLISTPYTRLRSPRRMAKNRRIAEMRLQTSIRCMQRSWQRSSRRIQSQQASFTPSAQPEQPTAT